MNFYVKSTESGDRGKGVRVIVIFLGKDNQRKCRNLCGNGAVKVLLLWNCGAEINVIFKKHNAIAPKIYS